jgi:hypothetical protein
MDDETFFCFRGQDAKEYVSKSKVGDTIKMSVTAVITQLGIEDGEPVVEFRVVEVSGKKKPYSEMDGNEIEREIHSVLNFEEPNREDGESIWKEVREAEKVGRTPFKRSTPFVYR